MDSSFTCYQTILFKIWEDCPVSFGTVDKFRNLEKFFYRCILDYLASIIRDSNEDNCHSYPTLLFPSPLNILISPIIYPLFKEYLYNGHECKELWMARLSRKFLPIFQKRTIFHVIIQPCTVRNKMRYCRCDACVVRICKASQIWYHLISFKWS